MSLIYYELVIDVFGYRVFDFLRGVRDRTLFLLYRDRDRDFYVDFDWVLFLFLVRERSIRIVVIVVFVYELLDSLDRRRDGWFLDRDRGERDLFSSRD